MVARRTLPSKGNPLIEEVHSPQYEVLVERRRLGRTNLDAKPGQMGVANASKPRNLGLFDYAHLRVPLPKNLRGSGIFKPSQEHGYPESYFLMRRSSDGFVSATGMFKAAFPWASSAEEETEREYHMSLPSVDQNEVAGNIWVHPTNALELADEYGMRSWILALLDEEPIEKGAKDGTADIATPPRFAVPVLPPPASGTQSVRKRGKRSVSPSKIATPSRKIASPRKKRTSKKSKDDDATSVASEALQQVVENGVSASVASESVSEAPVLEAVATNGVEEADTVKIQIDETTVKEGDKETTKTSVIFDMPAAHPSLPLPDDPAELLATAKAMAEKAIEADEKAAAASGLKTTTKKRKADELIADDEAAEASGAAAPSDLAITEPAAKKTKVLQQQIKKERVKTRAMIGVGITLAIGAAIPYFF